VVALGGEASSKTGGGYLNDIVVYGPGVTVDETAVTDERRAKRKADLKDPAMFYSLVSV